MDQFHEMVEEVSVELVAGVGGRQRQVIPISSGTHRSTSL